MAAFAPAPMGTMLPGTVLCCLCGTSIAPNPAAMCAHCIRSQVDITEGIQKQCTVLWCKECNRWLNPPKAWVRADMESKELLTFCVKKVKGLNKVKLVDAGFLWTEPHSRRLKVKVSIQKEVLNGAILQQTFVVEYVVEPHMCEQCQRSNTNSEVWIACVQVRQKVEHKRTFLFLEQLILKHSAEENAVGVKEAPDGLDFFYAHRSHALKMVDFLNSVVAIRSRADKQLVSADHNSNTFNYKYTFSIELVPICKEDLVCLPHKVYSALGGLGPVLLCVRVSNQLTLVDVTNLRAAHVDAVAYWRAPYKALMSAAALVEFIVLDVEPVVVHGGGGQAAPGSSAASHASFQTAVTSARWLLADVTVAKASDFGRNDAQVVTRTHLGGLLKAGDTVLGYDVAGAVLVDPELDTYRSLQLPDVILVRKSYAARRRQRRQKSKAAARPWTLRRLAMESADDDGGALAHGGRHAADVRAAEEEAFLEEIEEDPELRARIALYRRAEAQQQRHRQQQQQHPGGDGMGEAEDEEDEEDDIPEVPLEELLEEMTLGGGGGGDHDMDE